MPAKPAEGVSVVPRARTVLLRPAALGPHLASGGGVSDHGEGRIGCAHRRHAAPRAAGTDHRGHAKAHSRRAQPDQGVSPRQGHGNEQRAVGRGVPGLLDPLLADTAAVVEVHHRLGPAAEVDHDEADARKQFALVPLDLGHHAARVVPRSGPVVEPVVEPLGPLRRSVHRTPEQMAQRVVSMGLRVQWRKAEGGPRPAGITGTAYAFSVQSPVGPDPYAMKITSEQLKDIVVNVAQEQFGDQEFPRRALMEASEEHVRAMGAWEECDDESSESADPKSKGLADIDWAVSNLKRDGRLENPARNTWRVAE